jgi:hypothetical protein
MTPAQQQAYQQKNVNFINSFGDPFGNFLSAYGPAILGAVAAVATGGAAAGAIGGLGGAIAGGAVGGVTDSAVTTGLQGGNLTAGGLAKSAVLGGATGGLGYAAAPVTSSLTSAGVPAPLASGLVKGGISTVLGAGGAALSGGNAGSAALLGGAGGFLSGAVSNATGSNALGKLASGLGGAAISPLLSGSSTGNISMAANGSNLTSAGSALAPSASTDSTLAGTIGSALPSILQSAAGAYGAQNAAEAVTNADTNAINTQQSTLGNINNIWATQQGLGQGADTALGSALGTNGQPANYSNFTNMPGYQFAVNQGTQAIQRQAAAMGSAYTPNTAAAVGQYVTGTAAQDYNTYISQLMGAAGLGSTANTGIATPTYQTGANISTLQQNQGYAQAAGVSGVSNAIGGFLGGATGSSLIGGGVSSLLGGNNSGSGVNGSGVPSGNGSTASNAADPFSGTSLANNQNAINNYNQTGVGNTSIDPSTGQPWASSTSTPSVNMDNYTPSVPSTDFDSLNDSGDSVFNFLGGP